MEIIIYKKSQQQEEFCWDKLGTSIEKSCLAVGHQPEQAKLFATQVCHQLKDWLADKTEITSHDLRHQTQQLLTNFSPKASQYYQTFNQII